MSANVEIADPRGALPRSANVGLNNDRASLSADPCGPEGHKGTPGDCDDALLGALGLLGVVGFRPANSGGLKWGWSWQPTTPVSQLIRINRDNGGRGRAFGSWASMVRRCYDKRFRSYGNYGARGVRVCSRWLGPDGYATFVSDMGKRPSLAFSLDRYPDPYGEYSPKNCRWATAVQQANNKRPRLEPFSMKPPTEKQLKILRFIASHVVDKGYAPTLREIGGHFGIRSTNAVNDHLYCLQRKGMLTHGAMKSRAIVLTVRGWDHAGGREKIQEHAVTTHRVSVTQPTKCQACGASTFNAMLPCVICKVMREENAA